ncbi:Uncharacterised protein [Yersinia frederiksenii]|uniref:DUF4752 family protein n=1 Tax=Yersinia frederiksenii TaxID=29484 RepID=UPI0005E257A2|nr:DUF4752 family protein [Yersinia frederiksenii]CND06600.1 Uncharacterised protein [Yersinia frederiksenii]
MSIVAWLNIGLSLLCYMFIMAKTGEWIVSVALKKWSARRKEERKQKAINELYDAFNLGELTEKDTLKAVTKNGLTIMMFRK